MNDNLSEMIGKHSHNEMQVKFPYGVFLVKKKYHHEARRLLFPKFNSPPSLWIQRICVRDWL